LPWVYANASPKIFRNNEEAEKKALKELMPAADDVAKMGDWTIHDKHAKYFIAKKGGETIGYVISLLAKGTQAISIPYRGRQGLQGPEDQYPCPWRDRRDWETKSKRFVQGPVKGKDIDHLKVLKTETTEYIQALSGATISTRAVSEDAVKNGVAFLIKTIREGGNKDVQHQHN